MIKSKVFLTKDALYRGYLPIYGNKYWSGQTPNLDEIASKGTVFDNFYTAAPSSAMSYLSMFTGNFPYQLKMETYRPVNSQYDGETLFDKAYDMGYSCHIIWDESWVIMAKRYSECYGKHTLIHNMKGIEQPVGSHFIHKKQLSKNNELVKATLERIRHEIEDIFVENKPVFLWIHLPHVINGETCYGSDIYAFDACLGILREFFDDDEIFVSADHGNMNGQKGKLCYGFDVYNSAIQIPLITPRINDIIRCKQNVSNVDIFEILFNKRIPNERPFIYSDSAYYVQKHRKLAIIKGNYKYIYNNKSKTEELYDMEYDPNENFSLINEKIYDVDRKVDTPVREEYFYPNWDAVENVIKDFRDERIRIWRKPSFKQKFMNGVKDILRPIYVKLTRKKN